VSGRLARSASPAALVLVALFAARASAAGDYQPKSTEWNGLSALIETAHAAGCDMQAADRLDWSSLGPKDVLWFVYPRASIDPRTLDRWLRGGGRIVIADDFGAADAALRALFIRRSRATVDVPDADRYHHNAALPIARPALLTPLGRSTDGIVANHPATFESAIPPTFRFGPGAALVVEGTVARGRFVAVADPSVFINNMLEIDGNRAFARALVAETCRAGRDRILLFTQTFAQSGEPPAEIATPEESASVFAAFNDAMGDVNRRAHDADGRALTLLAALLALITAALLAGAFPAHAPLGDQWTRAQKGEFSWQLLSGIPWDYGLAAAIVRDEMLERLRDAIGSSDVDMLMPQELGARVRARFGAEAGQRATELWRLLHRVRWRTLDGTTAPDERVPRGYFVKLHRAATALFDALEPRRTPGV
jgi:Domain of unknown function (DUF4350)